MAQKTLKRKVIYATVLIVFLSGLLSLSVVTYITYRQAVAEKETSLNLVVGEQANKISLYLKEPQDIALHIANTPEIKNWMVGQDGNSKQNISDLLNHFNINNQYLAIYLINTDGKVLISTDKTLEGNNYSFRDYFQKSLKGNPTIQMAIGVTTGQAGYYFYQPIKDSNDKIIGVTVLKMDPKPFNTILDRNSLSNGDKIMLSDNNGIILYSNYPERIYKSLGKLSDEALKMISTKKLFSNIDIKPLQYDGALSMIKNGQTSIQIEKLYDVVDRKNELLTVSPIPNTPFFLIVETNFSTLVATAFNLSIIIGLLIFLSALIAIFWISIFATRNLKPLITLKTMAENLGQGIYTEKNPIASHDDLEELGEVFTKMSHQLKNYYGEMEKRVKERTKELETKNTFLEDAKKAIINILEDVEIEKNKTSELAHNLEKFKMALDNASDHIVITDVDGIVLYGNKGVERVTGYKLSEAIGKKAGQLWRLPMPTEYYKNLWETIKTKKQLFEGEIKNKRKNGKEYDAHVSIFPVLNSNKEIEFFVGIERDVTHEKEVDRAKTEFVSLASHQLRTPLSSINWYAEMLLAGDGGKLNKEQASFVDEIYKGNQRMVELVNSLLNVSRLELGTFAVKPEPTDIIKTAQDVLSELKPGIENKKLDVCFEYDKKIPIISADPKLIRIVFQNILSNSVKYTPENGKIKLTLGKDEKNLYITSSDTGYGIPKNQQAKIFTKLFRADNVRERDTEGTGLGLYIVKSIVDHSEGTITFESEENKGTTFHISLPLDGMKKKDGNKKIE